MSCLGVFQYVRDILQVTVPIYHPVSWATPLYRSKRYPVKEARRHHAPSHTSVSRKPENIMNLREEVRGKSCGHLRYRQILASHKRPQLSCNHPDSCHRHLSTAAVSQVSSGSLWQSVLLRQLLQTINRKNIEKQSEFERKRRNVSEKGDCQLDF